MKQGIDWILKNLTEYMMSLLTGAYSRVDERNIRKGLPLETHIGRLFSTFGWGLDVIRNSADNARLWSDLDYAKGIVLDRHGLNWGVARGGSNDDFYRLMIRIKILAQLSEGDIETILSAVAGLYDIDPVNIYLEPIYPAKLFIMLKENDLPPNSMEYKELIGELTQRLLGHGIGLEILYTEEDATTEALHLGGKVVSEFTRIRLGNYIEEPKDLVGKQYLGGKILAEFTRIRLQSSE